MYKDVLISTQTEFYPRLVELVNVERDLNILEDTFVQDIQVMVGRPIFPTSAQLEYLKEIGIPERKIISVNYRVYIGEDIEDAREMIGGLEFPVGVLESPERFREEVLYTIRDKVGSPRDN